MWIWKVGYLQYVMINDHSNRNAHHYIGQTYDSKEDALHMETHVAQTHQEHQSDKVKVRIGNINSFSCLPEPRESNCFKVFACLAPLLTRFHRVISPFHTFIFEFFFGIFSINDFFVFTVISFDQFGFHWFNTNSKLRQGKLWKRILFWKVFIESGSSILIGYYKWRMTFNVAI